VEPHEYDDLLRRLTALVVKLDERDEHILAMLVRMDQYIARQDGINERLTAAIERLDLTQARIETLLARLLQHGDHGRDA
jgi:hypothetical protein